MGRIYRPSYKYKGKKRKLQKFYIEYTDVTGRTRRRVAGWKREQAQDALRKAEADVLIEKHGLPTQKASEIICEKLLEEYLTEQKRRVCVEHLLGVRHHIESVLKGTHTVFIRDLVPEAVSLYLDKLEESGLAPRTVNAYHQSIKGLHGRNRPR